MDLQYEEEENGFASLTMSPTPESSSFQPRTLSFQNGPVIIGRTDGVEKIGGEALPTSSNGIFTQGVVSRKQAMISFENGRFFLQDLNSTHGTKVNEERLHSDPIMLRDGDILTFGRGGWYKNIQFKPVKAKIQLAFPSYDSVVPNSVDQLPWKETEVGEVARKSKDKDSTKEGAKGNELDKTASIESLIDALEKEQNRSPKTDRKLRGLQEALQYKKKYNISKKEAVLMVDCLANLSPGH